MLKCILEMAASFYKATRRHNQETTTWSVYYINLQQIPRTTYIVTGPFGLLAPYEKLTPWKNPHWIHKPEGPAFDSLRGHWIFQLT
jgi:hypothetical protein